MGWALGNVYYDKHEGIPAANSPLESLFILIALRRMEAELLATRAIVHASITADSNVDPTVKAFKDYADKIMPFLAAAQDQDLQKEKDALLRFAKTKVTLNKKMIYSKQAAHLNKAVGLDKFKLRPKMPGL